MNFILIAVLALFAISIVAGTIIAISKSAKNRNLTPRKIVMILIPLLVFAAIIGAVLLYEQFSKPVTASETYNVSPERSVDQSAKINSETIGEGGNNQTGQDALKTEAEAIYIDRKVYQLMKESYEDVTNIQQTFIDLRDGYYSATGLFTEANHAYINEMGETMQGFHQIVSQIDSSKISVPLAKENIEKLKANLDQVIPLYIDTVELYNQYYESGDTSSETIVQDIFGAYTNTEEFTNVYFYQIMGDLIAELQDNRDLPNGSDAENVNQTIEVDWETYAYEITDNSGYNFRITLKLTPFALVSKNIDYLKSAWNDIGANYSTEYELPDTLASWDLGDKGYHDMYYSIGEVEIENITDGWDITETNSIDILCEIKDKEGIFWYKPYFGNSSNIQTGKLSFITTMKRNACSLRFIILRPEIFNPKNPNGLYREYLESSEFKVLCQWINAGEFTIPLLQ